MNWTKESVPRRTREFSSIPCARNLNRLIHWIAIDGARTQVYTNVRFFILLLSGKRVEEGPSLSPTIVLSDIYSLRKEQLSWLQFGTISLLLPPPAPPPPYPFPVERSDIHQVREQMGEPANCVVGSSQVCPFEFQRQRSMTQPSCPRKTVDPWDGHAKTNSVSAELISVRELGENGDINLAGGDSGSVSSCYIFTFWFFVVLHSRWVEGALFFISV